MIASHQIQFLLNKRAEMESVLPYLGSYPEDGKDKMESTFLRTGDLVALYAESEDQCGFVSTLGYA